MKKFKQFMLAAIVAAFGMPGSVVAFNDLTQDQGQGQGQAQGQGQLQGQAQGQLQGQGQAQGQIGIVKSKNSNTNTNSSSSSSNSKAKGVGVGYGKASNQGNTNNISIEGDEYKRNTPSPHIALTSTGCIGSYSGSGTSPVVGIALGGTKGHDDCFKIEMAKVYYARGMIKLGDMMMQSTDYYKEAKSDADEMKTKEASFFQNPKTGKIVRMKNSEAVPEQGPRLVAIHKSAVPAGMVFKDKDMQRVAYSDAPFHVPDNAVAEDAD